MRSLQHNSCVLLCRIENSQMKYEVYIADISTYANNQWVETVESKLGAFEFRAVRLNLHSALFYGHAIAPWANGDKRKRAMSHSPTLPNSLRLCFPHTCQRQYRQGADLQASSKVFVLVQRSDICPVFASVRNNAIDIWDITIPKHHIEIDEINRLPIDLNSDHWTWTNNYLESDWMMLELEVIPEHGLLSEQMEIILGKPFIFKIMHSFASNLLMTQCSSMYSLSIIRSQSYICH